MNWYKKAAFGFEWYGWLSPSGEFVGNKVNHIHTEIDIRDRDYPGEEIVSGYDFLMGKGWLRLSGSSNIYAENNITKNVTWKQKQYLKDLAIENHTSVLFDNGSGRYVILFEEENNNYLVASRKIFADTNRYSWLSPDGIFFPNKGGDLHEDTAKELREQFYNNLDGSDSYDFLMSQGWVRVGSYGEDYRSDIVGSNFKTKGINQKQKAALIDLAIESRKGSVIFDNGDMRPRVLWQEENENYLVASKKIYSKDMIVERDNEFYDNYYNIGHGAMEVGNHPKKRCKSYIWAWDGQGVRDIIAGPDDAHSSSINGRWQGRAEFCPNSVPKVSLTSRRKFDQPSEDVINSLYRR